MKSKSILLGIALIGQGFLPAITAKDFGSVDWMTVQAGFAIIFLRLGIKKVEDKA